MKKSEWLYELCIYLLALLFLFTALSKILDFRHFVREMNNQVFNKLFASILIIAVPTIEIIASFLLLRFKYRLKGLWLSFILMATFSIYVGLVTFHFFPRVPCACAGVFKHMTWPEHLLFNIAFTLIALIGLGLNAKVKISTSKAESSL
ncbi:MauE/DoxX family redox-associated membrane protein [Mucilaginibacter lappiensis]|uniref:MauE/DoxX family redox-associated membrane protein n=1 Tax=Mucilaginibacter lappiensis TaxID=354630 RepID=UPI003D1AAD2A